MKDHEKAQLLAEALPYIRRFADKVIVIKYGGNAMIDEVLPTKFAADVTLLKLVGMQPVVVHGGGPQINQWLERVGKTGEFIRGMRVTDEETMQIVEMVLGGQVNKHIVSLINQQGGKAIGITGRDAHCIRAEKMLVQGQDNTLLDIGLVGEITDVDASLIYGLCQQGMIPVIAPIGVGKKGEAYNINADWVATKLAQALQAEKLILMTNTPGVLDRQGGLLSELSTAEVEQLVADGTLSGGMLPKIHAALFAARHGVQAVHIIDGRVEHTLLLELLTDGGVGTLVREESKTAA